MNQRLEPSHSWPVSEMSHRRPCLSTAIEAIVPTAVAGSAKVDGCCQVMPWSQDWYIFMPVPTASTVLS